MRVIRRGPRSLYRCFESVKYLAARDRRAVVDFLTTREMDLPLSKRLTVLWRFESITQSVRGYHTLSEMLFIARAILRRHRPVVLEAGCGYGASTAKLSLATALAGSALIACDTFRGMPDNDEHHELMDGRATSFRPGAFRGTLTSVKRRVAQCGAPEICRFEKGRFENTLPRLDVSADVVILDVDLVASTRACLTALWPKLRPGAVVISLDGQLRATHELLGNRRFWQEEVHTSPPFIRGLGRDKLLVIEPSLNHASNTISSVTHLRLLYD
jgi:O-methyltransferase